MDGNDPKGLPWLRDRPLLGALTLGTAISLLATVLITAPMVGPWWLFTPTLLAIVLLLVLGSILTLVKVRPNVPEERRLAALSIGLLGALIPPTTGLALFLAAISGGGH